MIVVADSGSTKTAWRLGTADQIVGQVESTGLNPLALDQETAIIALRNSKLMDWPLDEVQEVYFYAAGIVNDRQRERAAANLRPLFKNAKLHLYSDLLGAARAVFGDNQGVIGILGTGSNTGLYDGKKIVSQIPSLGYLLADEGSGSVQGRVLLRCFLRHELPEQLNEALKNFYPDYASLIETIYAEKHAAKFLASFVPFLYAHKDEPFVKELLLAELKKYIELLKQYPGKYKIGIVGSVGFLFQTELNLLARSAELNIVDYLKNPIDKLAGYHQNKMS